MKPQRSTPLSKAFEPLLMVGVMILALTLRQASAQDLRVLHAFTFAEEGVAPRSRLIEGTDGLIYGTTSGGGNYGSGTVFSMMPDGSDHKVLHHFNSLSELATPTAGVIEGTDGCLYGTASAGGNGGHGGIFALDRDGSNYQVLRYFSGFVDGFQPRAALMQGSDGRFFGTTSGGSGMLFAINADGSNFVVLYALNSLTDGGAPLGRLLQGSDGRLYGTTSDGGQNGFGTIFALNTDGTGFSILRHLDGALDGAYPYAGLIEGIDGRLFGTSRQGGAGNYGTVFALNTDGSGYAVLANLDNTTGHDVWPEGELVQADDGRLVGTTAFQQGCTIFAVYPDGTGYTALQILDQSTQGGFLRAGLLKASDGRLYGTAEGGGTCHTGTVFRLNQDGSQFEAIQHLNYRSTGNSPQARLAEGSDGRLYGTTMTGANDADGSSYLGGAERFGTIFAINRDGSGYTVLHNLISTSLAETGNALGGLVLSSDGRFYGSMNGGGYSRGAIYAIEPDGSGFEVIHSFGLFPDALEAPAGSLTVGADGGLYGMTTDGKVFRLNADGTGYSILHALASDGSEGSPSNLNDMLSELVAASDNRLYAATRTGGAFGGGTVFGLNIDGTGFTVLHHFNLTTDGYASDGSPIEGPDGRLYGTAYFGGTMGGGTLYAIGKDGSNYTVLHDFGGISPAPYAPRSSLVFGMDGRIYGATAGGGANSGGTLYSITTDGSDFEILHELDPQTEGQGHGVQLMLGSDGMIYGASRTGGPFIESGTIFSLSLIPEITSPPTAGGVFAEAFNYTITATNGPADFDALFLPPDLSVDTSSGEISGVAAQVGVFNSVVAASNSSGTGMADLEITIAKAMAGLTIGDLNQTYDGFPKSVSVTTDPEGLSVNVTYDGITSPPTDANSYAVFATINDTNYEGSATDTLTIAKATQTIIFAPIDDKTYGDAPFALTATASSGLPVSFTILNGPATLDGSTLTITGAGEVTVRVSQAGDANYETAAPVDQPFTVAKATAEVSITNTSFIFDGSPKAVTVTTDPAGLIVEVTYDGFAEAPSAPGSYAALAQVVDGNYQGNATAVLTISPPNAEGTLWAMGSNLYGQFGDGSTTDRIVPVQTATDVVSVVAGRNHSLFVKTDGTLWATGFNDAGQLGDGTTSLRTAPVQVATDVATVAGGGNHSLFVKTDGTLWAMGSNLFGQLGDGTTSQRTAPVQVATGVVLVAAGYRHSLFVKTDGTLWAMGENSLGQLGDGTTTPRTSPVQVATGVKAVACGFVHSLFVKTDGTLWATGENDLGQLGDGTTTSRTSPVQVATDVAACSGNRIHSLFVKTDGTLWAMGYNARGTLGDGTTTSRTSPVQIATGVAFVAAGYWHSLFVKTDGTLWATGDNSSGQLGDGTTISRTSPVQVATGVAAVAAGDQHSLFVTGEISGVAPWITAQPTDLTVSVGDIATFTVVATGTPEPSFEWLISNDGAGSWDRLTDGGAFSGTTTDTLTVSSATAAMSGWQFACLVSNGIEPDAISDAATLTVNKLSQSIDFAPLPNHTYGDAPFVISAGATSGLPVSFTVLGGPATIDGDTVTLTGAGEVTIRASQGGNTNFEPAEDVDRSFEIAPAPATISFGNTEQTYDGSPKQVTVATVPLGLDVEVTYDGETTLPVDPGTYAVVATITDPNYIGSDSTVLTIIAPPMAYTWDASIPLGNGAINPISDGQNLGKSYRIQLPITPVTLRPGDSLSGTVTFANMEGLRLIDDGGGFYGLGATGGYEQVQMEFRQGGANIITSDSFSMTFAGVEGPLLTNPIAQSFGLTNFPGTFAQLTLNLINPGTSFVFSGFDYALSLDSGGPVVVDTIAIQFQAEDIAILPPNQAPTAVAGMDQSIRAGNTVVLDGSGSSDDRTSTANLAFAWTLASAPAGSTAVLTGPDSGTPSFVVDLPGIYMIALVVIDEGQLSSASDVVIINSENLAPTAVATVDPALVEVGSPVHFDASGSSDPEGDSLTYAWMIESSPDGSTAALVDPTSSTATLMPDVAGVYEISLVANDPLGPGESVTVSATATTSTGAHALPVVVYAPGPGALTSRFLVGQSENIFTLGANASPANQLLDGASVIARDDLGHISLGAVISDVPWLTNEFRFFDMDNIVSVTAADGVTEVSAGPEARAAHPGLVMSQAISFIDGHGIARSFVTLENTGASPLTKVLQIGFNLSFQTSVHATSDGDAGSYTIADRWAIVGGGGTLNGVPRTVDTIVAFGDGEPEVTPFFASKTNDVFIDRFEVTVPPGEKRNFIYFIRMHANALAATADVAIFNNAGPDSELFKGLSEEQLAKTVNWDIAIEPANEAPTAVAGMDQSIRAGDTVVLDGSGSFDDNTAAGNLVYSWSFAMVPAGSAAVLIGPETVSPSFVADVTGTYVVQVIVTDEGGLSSDPSYVTVSSDNLAPIAVATASPVLVVTGNLVQLDGSSSSDPENDPITYHWSIASAPEGSTAMLASASSITTSFVPDVAGVYEIALTVEDALGPGVASIVSVTAADAEEYTETVVVETGTIIAELPPTEVTSEGNQAALSNFLSQILVAIDSGDTAEAINKLQKSIERTDGCVLRGTPDTNGPGRDWITDCDAQQEAYAALKTALDALLAEMEDTGG